jgi:hypothetical protein
MQPAWVGLTRRAARRRLAHGLAAWRRAAAGPRAHLLPRGAFQVQPMRTQRTGARAACIDTAAAGAARRSVRSVQVRALPQPGARGGGRERRQRLEVQRAQPRQQPRVLRSDGREQRQRVLRQAPERERALRRGATASERGERSCVVSRRRRCQQRTRAGRELPARLAVRGDRPAARRPKARRVAPAQRVCTQAATRSARLRTSSSISRLSSGHATATNVRIGIVCRHVASVATQLSCRLGTARRAAAMRALPNEAGRAPRPRNRAHAPAGTPQRAAARRAHVMRRGAAAQTSA